MAGTYNLKPSIKPRGKPTTAGVMFKLPIISDAQVMSIPLIFLLLLPVQYKILNLFLKVVLDYGQRTRAKGSAAESFNG